MIVEIVGGPKDGEQVAMPDGTRHLRVAVPMNMAAWLQETPLHPSLDVRMVEMDIVHYPWGNYAYWREPC